MVSYPMDTSCDKPQEYRARYPREEIALIRCRVGASSRDHRWGALPNVLVATRITDLGANKGLADLSGLITSAVAPG